MEEARAMQQDNRGVELKPSGPVIGVRNRLTPERERERRASEDRTAFMDASALESQLQGEVRGGEYLYNR